MGSYNQDKLIKILESAEAAGEIFDGISRERSELRGGHRLAEAKKILALSEKIKDKQVPPFSDTSCPTDYQVRNAREFVQRAEHLDRRYADAGRQAQNKRELANHCVEFLIKKGVRDPVIDTANTTMQIAK